LLEVQLYLFSPPGTCFQAGRCLADELYPTRKIIDALKEKEKTVTTFELET